MKHWAAATVVFGLFFGTSALLYLHDFSGIPDDGPVPLAMLPSFLFRVSSEDVRSCWRMSCAAWLLPPLIMALRGWRDGALGVAVLLLGAWLSLPKPDVMHEDYVPSFTAQTRTEGLVWLLALATTGALVGTLTRAGRSRWGSRQGPPAPRGRARSLTSSTR